MNNKLNDLIKKFKEEQNGTNMYSILLELLDCELNVPMILSMSQTDMEQFSNANFGDTIISSDNIICTPDLIEKHSTEKFFYPIFSTIEESGKDYSENFSWLNLNIKDCIDFVEQNKECSGIILNAFTNPIIITGDIYNVLKELVDEKNSE